MWTLDCCVMCRGVSKEIVWTCVGFTDLCIKNNALQLSLLLPSQDCRLIGLPSSPFRALHHSELPYTTVILVSGPRKFNTFSWSTVKQIAYHNDHYVSRVSKYSCAVKVHGLKTWGPKTSMITLPTVYIPWLSWACSIV
jgi:hypothetical protein